MKRSVIVAISFLLVVFAGCLDTDDEGNDGLGDQPRGPDAPGTTPDTAPPVTIPGTSEPLWSKPWQVTGCTEGAGGIRGTYSYMEANLPEPYSLSGGPAQPMVFLVQHCDALVVGNDTLVEDFGIAFLYAFLDKMNDTLPQPEAYVFEVLATDERVVTSLQELNWSVKLATIDIQTGNPTMVRIVSEGLEYSAVMLREGIFPEGPSSFDFLFRGAAPDDPMMAVQFVPTVDAGFLDPGPIIATGGTLGYAMPGGLGFWQAELVESKATYTVLVN